MGRCIGPTDWLTVYHARGRTDSQVPWRYHMGAASFFRTRQQFWSSVDFCYHRQRTSRRTFGPPVAERQLGSRLTFCVGRLS